MGRGIALALPLAIVFYILYRFIRIFENIIEPIANKFGAEHILGELTITFLAILTILFIIFLLGLLMQISIVANLRCYIEGWILKLVPSLNHLKLLAAEKLDIDRRDKFETHFFLKGDQYFPRYIIEENKDWITLAIVKGTSTEPKDVMIKKRKLLVIRRLP